MTRSARRVLGFLLAMLLLASVSGCMRSSREALTLAGSTAFQPFAEKLAEMYLALRPDVQVNVQGGGSAVGIQAALSGAAQIGMVDLLTLPPEAGDLTSTVVARDGIAIVVHPGNPVSSLTAEMARAVFSGRIRNWKEVGGGDSPVRIIAREEGSGTRRSFDNLVLLGDRLARDALFQNSNGTVREAVASDSDAIGYISIGIVDKRVKAIAYGGAAPTNDNVRNGSYPLARPVFFLTRGPAEGIVKDYIDFVLSKEAQAVLEHEGLVGAR